MKLFTWHFHGYQPGDVLYRIHDSPERPIRFKERCSPVSLDVEGIKYSGENWTKLMLKLYSQFKNLVEGITTFDSKGFSVDVEPQTLEMLAQHYRVTFNEFIRAFEEGLFEVVLTFPFHPIVPHYPREIAKDVMDIMISFYDPLVSEKTPIGVWFPEAVVTISSIKLLSERVDKQLYIIGDEMQVITSNKLYLYSCNKIKNTNVFGHFRDRILSNAFSFDLMDDVTIASEIIKTKDPKKELDGVSYLHLLSTDLETLFYSPKRISKFVKILNRLLESNIKVKSVGDFIKEKLNTKSSNECKSWYLELIDWSSWSGFSDVDNGQSLDSRWLGLRRSDFKAYAKTINGKKISQLWKYALLLLQNNILVLIRSLIEKLGLRSSITRYFVLAFPHYASTLLGQKFVSKDFVLKNYEGDDNVALYVLRGYYEALMATKSCPRFWEVMDTRVTFQAGSLLASAIIDAHRAAYILGDSYFQNHLKNALSELLDFEKAYKTYSLHLIDSIEGWESSHKAWLVSLKSSYPDSFEASINAISRGAYYALMHEKESLFDIDFPEDVTPNTGHIPGEYFADWRVKDYCEGGE